MSSNRFQREKERILHDDLYEKVRHACEVHRQVRHYAQSFIKPGNHMSYYLNFIVLNTDRHIFFDDICTVPCEQRNQTYRHVRAARRM